MTEHSRSFATYQPFSGALPQEAPFHVRITPSVSLSSGGWLILAGGMLLVSLTLQICCLACGAWPGALFVALDTAGLLFAVHWHRRSQERYEDVLIDDGFIRIRSFKRGRLIDEVALSQFGLAIECWEDDEFGFRQVILLGRPKQVEIARDLSSVERSAFLDAFLEALCRQGARPRIERCQGLGRRVLQ
jgi:uncharacterized membrane protein